MSGTCNPSMSVSISCPFRMMPDRMSQVDEQLRPLGSTPVNRDFEPIAYYFDIVLWSTQFKEGHSDWFAARRASAFSRVVAAVVVPLLLVAVLLASVGTRERRARFAAVYCAATTGFTLIALQIVLLLAFQSIYGYVYYQACDSDRPCAWRALRWELSAVSAAAPAGKSPHHAAAMAHTQFLLALSAPALIFVSVCWPGFRELQRHRLAAQTRLPCVGCSHRDSGGYQFPIATRSTFMSGTADRGWACSMPSICWSGCAGALVVSSYLIPVFGFWKTAWLSAAINLVAALLAARVPIWRRRGLAHERLGRFQ